MSTVYIDNEPHTLIARARPAGPPFQFQDGSLVGIDYQDAEGGGVCNLRMTKEQAHALRDVLHAYLTRGPLTITIAKSKHKKLRSVEE